MEAIAPFAHSKTIRLLLVDDRKTGLADLIARLQENDPDRYCPEWATSFEEGFAALRRGDYDVGLFDHRLSMRNGANLVQVAAALRSFPVILLIGPEEDAAVEAAASADAVDCLRKATLDMARLECSIRNAVRHARRLSRLRESQERLRSEIETARKREGQLLAAVTDNLPIIVGRLDREGRVTEATGSGLAAQGMAPAYLVGRRFGRLFPAAVDAIEKALKGKAAGCELRGGEGEKEWHVEFNAFPDASRTAAVVFYGRDVTIRKNLESTLINISDAERQRIGADLHDGLGQHLTGTACLAAALCEKLKADGSPHAAQAASIVALLNAGIDMTRGLARGLCPVQIEVGSLCSALEDFTYQVQRLHRVKCRFHATGSPLRLEQRVALHLYRIAQEAVNNALRHSSADEILVTLDRAYLAIEDNGCGFDPAALSDNRRLGLRLMEYRSALVGGVFNISRRPAGGMRVECLFSQPFS